MHAMVTAADSAEATVEVWFADDKGTTTTSGTAVIGVRSA
jgi:hypothetical protein